MSGYLFVGALSVTVVVLEEVNLHTGVGPGAAHQYFFFGKL